VIIVSDEMKCDEMKRGGKKTVYSEKKKHLVARPKARTRVGSLSKRYR
jgi:hypothetical protein